jgi:beta-galactosidase
MRKTLAVIAVLIAGFLPCLTGRDVTQLNDGWKFIRDDAGVFASSRDWGGITLPHTWNALDGQAGPEVNDRLETEAEARAAKSTPRPKDQQHLTSGYYRGACWYDRGLSIPAEWRGTRRVFVRFEAASTVARVFLNGTLLGEHRGAFTAFCFELTDLLNYGGDNQLRVQVDNSHREDLPPLSGDFNLFGGLYRPAALIVTGNTCISPLDYASPGVYLTLKDVNSSRASVEVRTILSDHTIPSLPSKPGVKPKKPFPAPAAPEVRVEVRDCTGKVVATASGDSSVPAEGSSVSALTVTIPSPHLWNGRTDPYLYSVRLLLIRGDTVLDEVTQPLGLRTVAIDEEKGFLLNGQPYPVHGVNRHQNVRNKGWAISNEDDERDAALMKEMGVTAVRNAHYPQSESWHRINDREGVLLWDEVSLVNETRSSRAFWLNSEEFLREMIHQLYNHPSVAWWGIFNELGNRPLPLSDEGLSQLRTITHELDPSRLIVGAAAHLNRSFNKIPDFICFNAYPAWYFPTPPEDITKTIAAISKEVGGKRVGISEYGAGANISHHSEDPLTQPRYGGPFHPEEWQAYVHEGIWAAIRDNPKVWGSFVWNMFDFAVQGRREGNLPALNDKGLVTHDRRFRKDAFYFYQANWTKAPMVHIASQRFTPRQKSPTEVKIYSNCAEVELCVNGTSVGHAKPDDVRICRFPDVHLAVGENQVKAIGKSPSTTVTDDCTWVLTPTDSTPR